MVWLRSLAAGLVVLFSFSVAVSADETEGTWRLVKRVLADGTTLTPPQVIGLETVYHGHKHVNVFWTTGDGKSGSFSAISEYTLTDKEIKATLLAMYFDDGSGKPPQYVTSGGTKTEPVTRQGSAISFQYPLQPTVNTYDGDKLTAKVAGAFTDYLERVK